LLQRGLGVVAGVLGAGLRLAGRLLAGQVGLLRKADGVAVVVFKLRLVQLQRLQLPNLPFQFFQFLPVRVWVGGVLSAGLGVVFVGVLHVAGLDVVDHIFE
jgi:hypothetical protein